MGRTTQRQEAAQDTAMTQPMDPPSGNSTNLYPGVDSTSDNDTSEKPVREKLKKTSLASISTHALGHQEAELDASKAEKVPSISSATKATSPLYMELTQANTEPRGRPLLKKRSFDDLETPEQEKNSVETDEKQNETSNGHIRKRSRDVRIAESLKEERRASGLVGITVQEEQEIDVTQSENLEEAAEAIAPTTEVAENPTYVEIEHHTREAPNNGIGTTETAVQNTTKDIADQEMLDSAPSPRKKRSRDQFDNEADREQKIVATEEARAHRRSDELERTVIEFSDMCDPKIECLEDAAALEREPDSLAEGSRDIPSEAETAKVRQSCSPFQASKLNMVQKPPSTFGSASTLSPSPAPAEAGSHLDPKTETESSTTDKQPQTSAAAFVSSGFAALSGSLTSPFGTLGTSSTTTTTSTSFTAFSPLKIVSEDCSSKNIDPAANGRFGSFAKSSVFGATEPSPFGTPGVGKGSVFGGSVLGGGFGSAFGGGSKLTSFAAPTGDTRLGASNGAVKAIGSPSHDGDDGENSESDADGLVENGKEEENEETDDRFQQQDGRCLAIW